MKEIVELVKPRNKVNAFYFGAAGGCIHYDGKTKLDAKSVASKGAMLGSNTIIVVDEKQSIVDVALNVAKFFRHESCGKCTPCREGNLHVVDLLSKVQSGKASVDDLKLLKKLSVFIKDTSLCGLGQSCTNHVLTALEYFGGEFNVK